MKRTLLLARRGVPLVLLLLAIPLALSRLAGPALARNAAHPRCRSGAVPAVIGGRHVCLRAGHRCRRAFRRQYRRYGFICQTNGRLKRVHPRHQPTPKPPPPPPPPPRDVRLSLAGARQVVFDWTTQRCADGYGDIPDEPAHAFRDASGQVQLIAGNDPSRRFVGPDLNHLTHLCGVILGSAHNGDPAAFNDHQWFAAPYTLDGQTVYALVHDEYHGYEHPGACPTTTNAKYLACWYNAITLGVSTDAGMTYTDLPAPNLVFGVPYQYQPGAGPEGIFTVSNIVHNTADGYYYALGYVNLHSSYTGTCVMRTSDVADPSSWRAWSGGTSFAMSFVDPYGPNPTPAAHLCRPIPGWNPHNLQPDSLTYNTVAHQWLLVGAAAKGVYYSLSPNLVDWTNPRLFYAAQMTGNFQCGDPNPIEYPSLIDPASPSRNFETSGDTAYLYFTLLRYNCPQAATTDRDLVRVPVTIGAG